MTTQPRFAIGTQYKSSGKHSRICTITDIHKTFNSAGELVRVEYVATHEFMGQSVTDWHVCDVTIAKGLLIEVCSGCRQPLTTIDRVCVGCGKPIIATA